MDPIEEKEIHIDWRTMENIRVISRFRPIGKHEKKEEKEQHYQDRPPQFLSNQRVSLIRSDRQEREPIKFTLDHQFPPPTSQKAVFNMVGRPMIEAVLEGYNATIFAYGQTGSGKTYTMFGPESRGSPRDMGLVQRSINHLFEELRARAEPGRGAVQSYTVSIMFLQIYKEELLDLLDPSKAVPVKIKWDFVHNCPKIPNVKTVEIASMQEVLTLLLEANANRIVASHKLNAHSSRSHMMVMLNVLQHVKTEDGDIVVRRSKLNFGDLAGSEDIKKALGDRPDPERLAEAKKINLSLTMLTQAINFLSRGQKPSYRSSTLTYALQDSLGGNSKTTMMVAASPHLMNRTETIRTLRFAVTAKTIKNKAKLNEELTPAQLKKRIAELEKELAAAKTKILELMNLLRANDIDFDPGMVAQAIAAQAGGAPPAERATSPSAKHTNGRGPPQRNGPEVVEPPEQRKLSIGGATTSTKPSQRVELSMQTTSSTGHRASQAISREEYDALIMNLKTMTERYELIMAENQDLTEHLQSKDQELHHLTTELGEMTEFTATSSTKIKDLQNENQTLERRVEELRDQLLQQTEGQSQAQKAIDDQIKRLQRNHRMAKDKSNELEAQVKELELRLDHVTAEKDSLQEQVHDLTANPDVVRQYSEKSAAGRTSISVPGGSGGSFDMSTFEGGVEEKEQAPAEYLLKKFGVAGLVNDFRLTPEQRMVKTAKIMTELSEDMGQIIGRWHATNKVHSDRKQSEMVFQIRQLIGHFNLAMNKLQSQETTFKTDLQFQLKRKDAEIRNLQEQVKDYLELRDDMAEKEEQIQEHLTTIRHLQDEKAEWEILRAEAMRSGHNRDMSRDLSYLRKQSMDSILGEPSGHHKHSTMGSYYPGSYDPQLDTLLETDDTRSTITDSSFSPLRIRASTAVPNRENIPQWRLDLQEMDKVDALDKFDTWYPATIVRIRNNDLVRIHYDGFAERYDEWIERDSSRLAQHESRTQDVGKRSIAEMAPVDQRDGVSVYKTGFLTKEGKMFRTYRTRYFVLFGNKKIKYYKGIDSEQEQGTIDLADLQRLESITWDKPGTFGFEIQTSTRVWRFQSGSERDIQDWIQAIRVIAARSDIPEDNPHDI